MRYRSSIMLTVGFLLMARASLAAPRELVVTALPAGTLAAGGCFDASGTLHVAQARNGTVHYARRPPGARELTVVSAIPANEPPAFVGDRVPLIAVHPTGKIFVLWQNRKGMALVASADAGRTWSEIPAASIVGRSGVDVPTMALAPDGTLHVLWVDERDPALPDDAIAKHLYLASSTNAGKTFSAARRVTTDPMRACPCCTPAIAAGPDGRVWIAYRSSVKDTKETALLASTDAGKSFEGRILTHHGWVLQGCPMSGPSIAVARDALRGRANSTARRRTPPVRRYACGTKEHGRASGGATSSAPRLAWTSSPQARWSCDPTSASSSCSRMHRRVRLCITAPASTATALTGTEVAQISKV